VRANDRVRDITTAAETADKRTLIIFHSSPPPEAITIATIPARIAWGRLCQAATTVDNPISGAVVGFVVR